MSDETRDLARGEGGGLEKVKQPTGGGSDQSAARQGVKPPQSHIGATSMRHQSHIQAKQ